MRVTAVIVTYNRKSLLQQCIEHVRAQQLPSDVELAILVIDNASTDGTKQALQLLVQDGVIRYVNTGENLGGAGGFSFGMNKALQDGCDYVWVMDDDCLPDSCALAALLDAGNHVDGNFGYLSSVVRWTDGSICKMNVQRHPLFSDITDFDAPLQPCTLASFVSLLVPADVVREVGLPIAEFFIWTDDWEFTRRISRIYPCYVVGGSKVVHASATNSPGTIYTDTADRLDRYRYIYRNDCVLYREEGWRGKLFLSVRKVYHKLRVLLGSVDEKSKRLQLITEGYKQGKTYYPEIQFPD